MLRCYSANRLSEQKDNIDEHLGPYLCSKRAYQLIESGAASSPNAAQMLWLKGLDAEEIAAYEEGPSSSEDEEAPIVPRKRSQSTVPKKRKAPSPSSSPGDKDTRPAMQKRLVQREKTRIAIDVDETEDAPRPKLTRLRRYGDWETLEPPETEEEAEEDEIDSSDAPRPVRPAVRSKKTRTNLPKRDLRAAARVTLDAKRKVANRTKAPVKAFGSSSGTKRARTPEAMVASGSRIAPQEPIDPFRPRPGTTKLPLIYRQLQEKRDAAALSSSQGRNPYSFIPPFVTPGPEIEHPPRAPSPLRSDSISGESLPPLSYPPETIKETVSLFLPASSDGSSIRTTSLPRATSRRLLSPAPSIPRAASTPPSSLAPIVSRAASVRAFSPAPIISRAASVHEDRADSSPPPDLDFLMDVSDDVPFPSNVLTPSSSMFIPNGLLVDEGPF